MHADISESPKPSADEPLLGATTLPDDTLSLHVQPLPILAQTLPKPCETESQVVETIPSQEVLSTFLNMPLDIRWEICRLLGPLELLQLARSSKELRIFLLNRAHCQLWVLARINQIGLPERPPSLSEPAFANFLYSITCENCAAPDAWRLLNGHFLRLCEECFESKTIRYYPTANNRLRLWPMHDLYGAHWARKKKCLLEQEPEGTYACRILKADLDEMCSKIKVLANSLRADTGEEAHHGDLEAVRARCAPLLEDLQNKFRESTAETKGVLQWVRTQDQSRRAEQERRRQQRFKAIVARLEDLGWKEEIEYLGEKGLSTMSTLPSASLPYDLTETDWQDVYPGLCKFLEGVRERLRDKQYRDLITARMEVLEKALVAHYVKALPRTPEMDCRPQPIDFALTPECRAILDVPASVSVTPEQFSSIIPPLAEKWDAEQRQALLDYIVPLLGDIADDVDPLRLAIAYFKTGGTTKWGSSDGLMRYPDILAPSTRADSYHLRRAPLNDNHPDEEDSYAYAVKTLYWRTASPDGTDKEEKFSEVRVPYSLARLAEPEVARVLIESFRRVVSALGFNPARATFDELQQCGRWLRCAACERKDDVVAFTWLSAAQHDRAWHCEDLSRRECPPFLARRLKPAEWMLVDEAETAGIRTILCQYGETHPVASGIRVSCSLCADFNSTSGYYDPYGWSLSIPSEMPKHIMQTHGLTWKNFEEALLNGVIYIHPSEHGTRSEIKLGSLTYGSPPVTSKDNPGGHW
ncbi:hypothetical protein C8Q77DRAFT_1122703 [Trametes polyzona]|nr:hypothetical protein C8Q77DRAFT_1122703 [Trametes polyzona]